jgi:hypothetical protein
VEGCFRYFTTNANGVQFNTQFSFEDWRVGDMQGIVNKIPSKISIEALENSTLIGISTTMDKIRANLIPCKLGPNC